MKPCKEWTGARSGAGYGQRSVGGRVAYLHRIAWEEAGGPIPSGLCVLHHCDNRACYEIEHLFLGTRRDNSRDMAEKRRSTIGERNPQAKLTASAVAEIRSSPERNVDLARRFGCDPSAISHVRRRKSWGRA